MIKKKRLLILVNHDIVIFNFRRELVESLIKENYEVYISSPYGERIDKLLSMGCKYIETEIDRHSTNPINDLKLLNFYKKIIRDIDPSVILTYTIKPNIYGGIASKSLKKPYIANITGLGTAVEKTGLMQKLTIILYKFAFKNVNRVFFQNIENKKFFENNNIANNRHRLIPGSGVNLNFFRVLEYPLDDKVEFVFISRIMKEKGIDQFIEAAKHIKSKYLNTRFHICGFCEEAYEYQLKLLDKKEIIYYHGMLRDVRDILKQTHCTIHPTYYAEGMSNVLLESAACGRPIITTNRSGCREIVDDGINGYIVELKNSKSLIRKIEEFLSLDYNSKKNMGLAGRKKVEQEFNREIVVKAYMEEIENIHKLEETN